MGAKKGNIPWNKGKSKYAIRQRLNYCLHCGKQIPLYNKALKPRKYCTDHHKMTSIHGRPFQKGQIPWNKKNFYTFKEGQKNYCKYCNAEIPLLNRHGDPQQYCKGHETYAPKKYVRVKGREHHNWKGGRKIHQGYVLILMPEHPRAQKSGYVCEHILVAEKKLGRPLERNEIVHHKDRNRSNNDPDNLEIITQSQHCKEHGFLKRPRVLDSTRKCVECGSTKTKYKKHQKYGLVPMWHRVQENQWKCRTCYNREYDREKYKKTVLCHDKVEGKKIVKGGYLKIRVPDHPRADHRGMVLEHIVVAEQTIGRPLYKNEQVHHINGIRTDNRPENLEVMDGIEHNRMHGFNRKR